LTAHNFGPGLNQTPKKSNGGGAAVAAQPMKTNRLGIQDWRLEKPQFKVVEVTDPKSGEVHYETRGNLNTPVPPIRDSKYLTKDRDATSHYGDIGPRRIGSPISVLGDLIPVMAGVALGARLQGKQIAALTWIGDGGQSTGVTYEGINFAAVKKLGLVLVIESNAWAYSTPSEYQYLPEDLADRALGYGIPAVIIDGTDACQVYDATREAVERAHRGDGAS